MLNTVALLLLLLLILQKIWIKTVQKLTTTYVSDDYV